MGNAGLIALAVIGGIVLLVLIWFVATYNRFVRLRQHIRDSWADIDVEMQRRYELIPNLVETVKGYMQHERGTLEAVIDARNRAMANHGSPASQAQDESALMAGLSRLFALAEQYPQLKADTSFVNLQQELSNTEDRIAASRRFYNGNVRELNQLCEMFPSTIVAGMFGFKQEEYFEVQSEEARVAPKVAF